LVLALQSWAAVGAALLLQRGSAPAPTARARGGWGWSYPPSRTRSRCKVSSRAALLHSLGAS